MSWHAGDFHFVLQIAPFHNKNTMHIRLDMFRGKMEMFIHAAFDLSQSEKRSWQKNTTWDRRGWGSLCGQLGTPVGCGVRAGLSALLWALCDESEEQGSSVLQGTVLQIWPSAGVSREAQMVQVRQGSLQKILSPEYLWEKLLWFFFLQSLGCRAASGVAPCRELCTRSAWPSSTEQSRAPQSPAEASQACYLPWSTPYLQEQLWQAGSSGRETSLIHFPLLSVCPGSKTAL